MDKADKYMDGIPMGNTGIFFIMLVERTLPIFGEKAAGKQMPTYLTLELEYFWDSGVHAGELGGWNPMGKGILDHLGEGGRQGFCMQVKYYCFFDVPAEFVGDGVIAEHYMVKRFQLVTVATVGVYVRIRFREFVFGRELIIYEF